MSNMLFNESLSNRLSYRLNISRPTKLRTFNLRSNWITESNIDSTWLLELARLPIHTYCAGKLVSSHRHSWSDSQSNPSCIHCKKRVHTYETSCSPFLICPWNKPDKWNSCFETWIRSRPCQSFWSDARSTATWLRAYRMRQIRRQCLSLNPQCSSLKTRTTRRIGSWSKWIICFDSHWDSITRRIVGTLLKAFQILKNKTQLEWKIKFHKLCYII